MGPYMRLIILGSLVTLNYDFESCIILIKDSVALKLVFCLTKKKIEEKESFVL